jgi:hypothetical protein
MSCLFIKMLIYHHFYLSKCFKTIHFLSFVIQICFVSTSTFQSCSRNSCPWKMLITRKKIWVRRIKSLTSDKISVLRLRWEYMLNGLRILVWNRTKKTLAIALVEWEKGLRRAENGGDLTNIKHKPNQNCNSESHPVKQIYPNTKWMIYRVEFVYFSELFGRLICF